jgi:secretion/DNA translocation related TadE-like protein
VNRESGAVSIVVLGAAALCVMLLFAIGRLGAAAVLDARAQTAADAAALAAADQLALGRGAKVATEAAAATARANGATLVHCDCGGQAAEVEVELTASYTALGLPHAAHARSRAEVDLTRAVSP